MKNWKLGLALAIVIAIPLAWAGNVQNPVNAPASVRANQLAYWSGTNPQQLNAETTATFGQLPTIASGDLYGNATGSSGSAADTTLTALLDRALGSAQGDILYRSASAWGVLAPGTSGYVLETQGPGANPAWAAASGTGTVTSVGLSLPGIFSVSGSPVTSSGTLTGSLANENVNTVFAGPSSGGSAAPTFRSLVAADIPALPYVTSVAVSVPSRQTVSGSPITSSGTLAISDNPQNANLVFAGPASGSAAAPTFRALAAADLPAATTSAVGACQLANPSATIGLTAVNGATGNCMDAGSAPALSQSIAPVWTGQHQFDTPTINTAGASQAASTGHPAITLYSITATQSTSTGTAEQTLASYSLAANALDIAGRNIRITAWFKHAANSHTVTFRIYFGSESEAQASASSNQTFLLQADILKTGSSTQNVIEYGLTGGGSPAVITPTYTAAAEADTSAITIKATAQDGTSSAGDGSLVYMTIEYLN